MNAVPMAFVRELARRKVRDLTLVAIVHGMPIEWLVAAGCDAGRHDGRAHPVREPRPARARAPDGGHRPARGQAGRAPGHGDVHAVHPRHADLPGVLLRGGHRPGRVHPVHRRHAAAEHAPRLWAGVRHAVHRPGRGALGQDPDAGRGGRRGAPRPAQQRRDPSRRGGRARGGRRGLRHRPATDDPGQPRWRSRAVRAAVHRGAARPGSHAGGPSLPDVLADGHAAGQRPGVRTDQGLRRDHRVGLPRDARRHRGGPETCSSSAPRPRSS